MKELLLQGFLQYDWILFLLSLVAVVMLVYILYHIRKTARILKSEALHEADVSLQIVTLQNRSRLCCTLFESSVQLFLLTGLLGTVIALLKLFSGQEQYTIAAFYGTWTSTLWGLLFTTFFTGACHFLTFGIEANEKKIALCLPPSPVSEIAGCSPEHHSESTEKTDAPEESEPDAVSQQPEMKTESQESEHE